MDIHVSKPAIQWFKKEFNLEGNGEYVRFFARYGGCGAVQSGFSLGVSLDKPSTIGAKEEVDGLIFYVEDADLWYFDNHDLRVKYSRKFEEIEYEYEKSTQEKQ
ncbi:HesB/YadR/YfhF family protein [Alkalihalobacillus alcalophilus ATCC 27647 = CGMCC 1.3604]|uniref:HesB/YadR/YfhF family protein n=1 Tax=Alkalihalobacillus alcalophilus ATCC 27647 = CGMCC 1.3604 TaxID=1218173 RepID=A0A094XES8_ALKAL|nr:HesB/YadR/YfhF family protein [Alkalihalobacillus alcalophilus]KGA97250.1 hypothetical protein BALCAV_0211115 [Alkalihalobacillus alcalophilus ATCC 27647 = CGMCC 1.3604]MED1564083.1 HesB/YadR/YfhF family protein [Alkalihalobacillus alcalophilus]THG90459.1 HesB/YadR/YfhF family protein [Alkalihalobacillus alcalophilus ATCC 27647 = CGMCC 1.3604]